VAHDGGSPEHRRSWRPGAIGHHFACGLDREEEEDGAELTMGSWVKVEHWRGRAPMRGRQES
jgi:hypothetical protein